MGNRKNSLFNTVFILATIFPLSSSVQAEGFFSKLLGGSKSGADFKALMSHVPAETSYLLTNKKAIPDEVMEFHIKRGKEMIAMASKMQGTKASDTSEGVQKFFDALMEDYSDLLSKDKIEDTGLSLKANSLIYGYQMLPVMRLGFADKEKLMEMIKRAEEKSGYKVDLTKCGELDCFINSNDNVDFSVALVFLDDHLAASVYSPDKKQQMMDHLIGKADPKEAYSEDKWDAFLKENEYQGFGDGFINLKKIYSKAKPLIAAGMRDKIDEKEIEGCLAVIEQHLVNVSEILIGTKNLEAKKMDYELLVKTSTDVSEVLQGLANITNIAKRSENAIFDFGVNIDFKKLRDALTQYSGFLIKVGEANKCSSIKTQDIRKGMGGVAMVMNMGLTQFKSIYASVSDVELDDKMQPKNVDALVSLGTDDPTGLVAMIGMMSPAMMGFKVPDDGSTVQLPAGAIPSNGKAVPPIYLSRSENLLNIMVGDDKPAMAEYKTDTPQISFSGMDGKRYFKKFASIMKSMPNLSKEQDQLKILETIGGMSGKVLSETSADKRGLVINYHLQYE